MDIRAIALQAKEAYLKGQPLDENPYDPDLKSEEYLYWGVIWITEAEDEEQKTSESNLADRRMAGLASRAQQHLIQDDSDE
jgi:hypothetical protein